MDGKACRRDPPKRSVRYVCIGSSGWRSLAWARDGKAARCLRPPGQSESGRPSGPSGADSPVSDRAFADSSARRRASHLAWLGGGLVSNSRPIQSLSSFAWRRSSSICLSVSHSDSLPCIIIHIDWRTRAASCEKPDQCSRQPQPPCQRQDSSLSRVYFARFTENSCVRLDLEASLRYSVFGDSLELRLSL
jgi:hypothetical protein